MRRAEKEVKDLEQLEEILRDCNTVRIGTQDAEGMFIVPVNYGYDLTVTCCVWQRSSASTRASSSGRCMC